nr:helix-turn-helix domain-containing protein [Bacteroidota bacterium]
MQTFTFTQQEYQDLLKRLDEMNNKLGATHTPTQDVYDNAELMRLLKVSRRTLSTWRAEQLIEFSQIGSKIYYTKEAVNKFLETYRVKPLGK